MGTQVSECERAKFILSDQFFDDWEGLLQRLGQGGGDIVAIDRKTRTGRVSCAIEQTGGHGGFGVKKRGAKGGLIVHAGMLSRAAAARVASCARIGQSGTSLSHSTSSGLGPDLASV